MLNEHASLGIAQTIFYIPAILLAAYLLFYRLIHSSRPRLAWYVLLVFSLIRFSGGIVVVCYENNQHSVGLLIASVILLNVGVFPIIASTNGLLMIITRDTPENFRYRAYFCGATRPMRFTFLAGIALIIAGAAMIGQPQNAGTSASLIKAGYLIVVVYVVALTILLAMIWSQPSMLSPASKKVLIAASCAMPFFAVRLAYALLSIFSTDTNTWNSISGSIAPFIVMALLMEYIVVWLYLSTGLLLPSKREEQPNNGANNQEQDIEK